MNADQHAYVIFTRYRQDRLRFSDGSSLLYPLGTAHQVRDQLTQASRLPYEKWAAEQPRYLSARQRAEQWESYRNAVEQSSPVPVGEAEEVRGWRGYFFDATGSRELTDLIETEVGLVPAVEIAQALDSAASDGWQVVSVTEDKGLFSGFDTPREAGPVTIRILVRRSTS
ncbi:MAG: hypothetical protein JO144_06345 [Actinobacteria bacterium]|nr:hypothetical protein [Actinomycetota bacterium]